MPAKRKTKRRRNTAPLRGYKVFGAGGRLIGYRKTLAAARTLARRAAKTQAVDIYTTGGGMFGQGKKVQHVEKNPRRRGVAQKYRGDNRKIRRAKRSGGAAKLASYKKRSYARMVKALAETESERRARLGNPAPKKAKYGSWYKGPKGTRVRVRRLRGKIVVDVRK